MNKGLIDIEGVIGWEVTARDVKVQLKDMGEVDEIDVLVNSPGGYIDPGFGIFTALKNHPAKINIHITGMAASMASVIAMAGDNVTIEPTAMFMIHPPSNVVWGTAVEMRKQASVLDKYESRLITAYKRRDLNISNAELDGAVADETWYTAEEALEAGFVDEILDGEERDSDASIASIEWMRIAAFQNAPESITSKIKTNRAKAQKLQHDLINNSGPAVETTGDEMSKFTQAELDAAVKAATDAATDAAKPDADAVANAIKANNERYEKLTAHKNGSNAKAVASLARSSMSIEEALEHMDYVAVEKADESTTALSQEEIDKIGSDAAAKAIAAARAAASDTTNVDAGTAGDNVEADDEAALQASIDAANKRRGVK